MKFGVFKLNRFRMPFSVAKNLIRATTPTYQDGIVEVPLRYSLAVPKPSPRLAVLLHAYNTENLLEFRRALLNIPFAFGLYVSTNAEEKKQAIEACLSDIGDRHIEIRIFPNRGRDIAPKFVGFNDVHRAYDFVLHIHSKKSIHSSDLEGWRRFILNCLLGSPDIVSSIFEMFAQNPQLGIVAPRNFAPIRNTMTWGVNFEKCAALAEQMGIKLEPNSPLDFAAGSMFWARTAALKPLLDLNLTFEDFEEEKGQLDGALAHAIERLTFYSAERAGYTCIHAGPAENPASFEIFSQISRGEEMTSAIASAGTKLLLQDVTI